LNKSFCSQQARAAHSRYRLGGHWAEFGPSVDWCNRVMTIDEQWPSDKCLVREAVSCQKEVYLPLGAGTTYVASTTGVSRSGKAGDNLRTGR